MLKHDILSLLETLGQPHLAVGLDLLDEEKQRAFFQQLQSFDLSLRKRQSDTLAQGQQTPLPAFSPLENYAHAGNTEDNKRGETLIAQGKAGCIILAGGQGTRLGSSGPKGKVAVSPIKGKSLFQLFAERTKRASERAGRPLPLAIMTSPLNDQETRQFFEENAFFGLSSTQVSFFVQPVLPFCDDEGNWLLEEAGKLAVGPDGNGHIFSALMESGLWDTWCAQGIESISVIPIDNPLADPFDAEMIGFQERMHADVVIKTVPRLSAHEKMGVIVQIGERIGVVEYTELSADDANATTDDGSFKYPLANANLFCFHADFVTRALRSHLPLHLARKTARHFESTVPIWKFETFIFDLLHNAQSAHVLLCPRASTYAPLKNAEGDKSLTTVHAALSAFDHSIFKDLSGTALPQRSFELDPAFYYPTCELKQQWQGRELPDLDYIEP
jgi:UDP-N-acetylglucosamine/UDP-N-acetylgalactosamine diphosphorylase